VAYAALVLAGAIWGLTFPLMKFAIARFEPQHVAVYRVTFACLGGIVLLPTVAWGRWRWPARSDLGFLVLLGLLVGWGQGVAFTYGLAWTPATTAALIVPLNPIFTTLLASWWLEERVTALQWLGVGLAALGMVVLVLRRDAGVEAGQAAGPLVMALAPLSWAVFTVVSKPLLLRYHPPVLTTYTTALGALSILPMARPATLGRLIDATWTDLGAVVYVGAIALAGGFYLWYIGLSRLGAARAGSFALLVPLFGVLGGVLFLGEPIGWPLLAGGGLILGGMRLVLAPGRAAHG
jgi:drug/metabolite transporter (DMT)-like permease